LAEGWTPARIAATPMAELHTLFGAQGCRLSRPVVNRLLGRAASALPAHPAATVGKPATLAALLGTLAALDHQIADLEAEMAPLLARTQGAKLTQIRGVATVAAAGLVAFVGHTGRWAEWSKVWRAAGLAPARSHPAPPTRAMASARRARPGGEGPPWTWQPASGVNRDASETATEPAPSPGTSTPSPPWPPPATRSDGPCLP
jgi:hypothetical protein